LESVRRDSTKLLDVFGTSPSSMQRFQALLKENGDSSLLSGAEKLNGALLRGGGLDPQASMCMSAETCDDSRQAGRASPKRKDRDFSERDKTMKWNGSIMLPPGKAAKGSRLLKIGCWNWAIPIPKGALDSKSAGPIEGRWQRRQA